MLFFINLFITIKGARTNPAFFDFWLSAKTPAVTRIDRIHQAKMRDTLQPDI